MREVYSRKSEKYVFFSVMREKIVHLICNNGKMVTKITIYVIIMKKCTKGNLVILKVN
jgi:hypothetical protein